MICLPSQIQIHGHYPPFEVQTVLYHHQSSDWCYMGCGFLLGRPAVFLLKHQGLFAPYDLHGGMAWWLWRKAPAHVRKTKKKTHTSRLYLFLQNKQLGLWEYPTVYGKLFDFLNMYYLKCIIHDNHIELLSPCTPRIHWQDQTFSLS